MGATIIAVVTAIFGFLAGRKKSKVDINKTEAEIVHTSADSERIFMLNVQSAVNIYKTIANDLIAEMKTLRPEMNELRKENAELKKEMQELRQENAEMRKENADLKKHIIKLEKLLNKE